MSVSQIMQDLLLYKINVFNVITLFLVYNTVFKKVTHSKIIIFILF